MPDVMAAEMTTAEHSAAEARRGAYARVPFTRMMGVQRAYSEGGRARLLIDARPELQNVIGAVHGGVILTMLDVVMASAAVSLVDFTKTAVTLNLNTSFLRPGLGCIVADGLALETHDGVVSCSAEARDASGELVANALGSFRYLPLPPSES
ncbi:PaaI family thioesterase [Variovorax paradoxus]|uniref:PaaI family thioesterase n=1 Tax=Variovorax paradoxus TaxID=34073 RepID=UPI0027D7EDF5|nr:PaaI family thioesterase [Variovorax paradoxus]